MEHATNHQRHRVFKASLYSELGRIGKALASPQRLELLDLLGQGEWIVEDLAREAALSLANTSRHLQVLRQARLVEARKAGRFVYYRLADAVVFDLWRTLRVTGERQLAEVERLLSIYQRDPATLEPLTRSELRIRLSAGKVIALDVRPAGEFAQGHITGALSIPFDQLEARLAELTSDREIVAYCRGPYCLFAHDALDLLNVHGYQARQLKDGYSEWRAAQLPVASGVASAMGATQRGDGGAR
ncbi:MAG TPA: metalloregulator ArsR/SmtB family transcription factor [Ktedonobacterales bacterium]|jgi:rhodanese-related sulfurtransferase|nr:metalloregulator ArsR/SmtB family transcription factor [Ktedonobacterales bacterium]